MSRAYGIRTIHQRTCASRGVGDCNCRPSFQAAISDPNTRQRIRRNFPTQADAKAWRADALHQLATQPPTSGSRATIHQLGDELVSAMEAGVARTRSGDRYKPATIRGYRQTLTTHIYPELGGLLLSELRRRHVQDVIDRLVAAGVGASTVKNALMPLRVICRRAMRADELASNPLEHLDLPAVRTGRDRVATPAEVPALIASVDRTDRAIWATAFYAGLRRGELMALEIDAIDLDRRVIRVQWGWDIKEGRIPPKSRAGRRTVPISQALAEILQSHLDRLTWSTGLVFGRSPTTPFDPSVITERAYRIWSRTRLESYSLHEARHTYVSFLLAAGIHVKAVSTFAGHASISITLDRYGHLLPGSEEEAARRLDQLLAQHASQTAHPANPPT
jgi:integrase